MLTLFVFLIVILRLAWCPHIAPTGMVGLYMAISHIVIGMVLLRHWQDVQRDGWKTFFLSYYFWLWFIPSLIEGVAFFFLRR